MHKNLTTEPTHTHRQTDGQTGGHTHTHTQMHRKAHWARADTRASIIDRAGLTHAQPNLSLAVPLALAARFSLVFFTRTHRQHCERERERALGDSVLEFGRCTSCDSSDKASAAAEAAASEIHSSRAAAAARRRRRRRQHWQRLALACAKEYCKREKRLTHTSREQPGSLAYGTERDTPPHTFGLGMARVFLLWKLRVKLIILGSWKSRSRVQKPANLASVVWRARKAIPAGTVCSAVSGLCRFCDKNQGLNLEKSEQTLRILER